MSRPWRVLGLLLICLAAWSAPPLTMGGAERQPLAGHMEVLEGPAATTLQEAQAAAGQGRFRALAGDLARGYGRDPVWVRFTLEVVQGTPSEAWLEVRPGDLNHLTLYAPGPEGTYRSISLGARVPFDQRGIPHHTAVFPLGGPHGPLQAPLATCYLKLETRGSRVLSPILWTPRAFTTAMVAEGLLFGAFYGIALILAVANLIYWAKTRDPIQVHYAVYLLSSILLVAVLEGHVGQYLLPHADGAIPWLLPLAILPLPWVAVHLFSSLTEIGTVHPRLDRTYLRFGEGLTLATLGASLLGRYYDIAPALQVGLLLIVAFNLAGGIFMAFRGHRTARFYLLAWSPYILGVVFRVGRNLSLVQPGFLGDYGMYLGAIAHFGLMTFPLADRLGRLRRERDQALATAMEASVRHQRELEREVEARTLQLREEQARTLTALEAERQVVTEQRQFLSVVSHEFRTPLAVMDGAAQMARLSVTPPPTDLTRSTEAIQRGVGTLLHLLDTWLTADRIATGLSTLRPQPVDLSGLVKDLARQAGEASGRVIQSEVVDLPGAYPGDRDLLRAALLNLLDNALKYSPTHQAIQVRGRVHEGWIHLEVEDRGLGIPADQVEHIATRYFRGRNVGQTPGLGLGLHLVRAIAELHGGRFELESVEGGRTVARILLPPSVQG